MALISGKTSLDLEAPSDLDKVVARLSRRDPTIFEYLRNLNESRKTGEVRAQPADER